eukprot:CAMPEP_0177304586 /NCGR_PEP_ID=MMETSP0368-20130122/6729_1 /TAXON_ID=447022 ORGANISM="Scrippsiella hangoei-like, Strain SHHI-4" /NCGR_SAMPLE_ID=MMETSP0368 /ASSEMBLY_ACC=CAM_ASM_000363 /LENGTH=990 /DNA_ID=CAMNT_0018763177 /DNA_START=111 /DNA_END=3083 /DNA_ORIENTATION=+
MPGVEPTILKPSTSKVGFAPNDAAPQDTIRKLSGHYDEGLGKGEVGVGHGARKAIRAGDSASMKQFAGREVRQPRCGTVSRRIVENSIFVCCTMALTIYALVADDFRLMSTPRSADPVFNWMVVLCIVVFGIECILSVLGKADYLWSFFFWLDIISTGSLVLDITVVADTLFASQHGGSEVRGGRAAKIGAKAGRVVRVLRLVRILKLYKAYYEAKALERRKRHEKNRPGQDEDDWDDEDVDAMKEKFNQPGKESQVGKKLSELTTRRVICIIMAMMLGLQILEVDETDKAAFSSLYGAEIVWRKFTLMRENGNSSLVGEKRDAYEKSLLKYIYYHNWFAREDSEKYCPMQDCAGLYYSQLFWVGIVGSDAAEVQTYAQNASLQHSNIGAFEKEYARVDGIYNYGFMPTEAQAIIKSEWTIECQHSSDKVSRGISLLSQDIEGLVSHKVSCPQEELRSQEYMYIYPRGMTSAQLDDWYLAFYFDLRPFTRAESMYNIINTMNILILLVSVSLVFANDANRLIVHPVERMIKRVESIRDNPLIAMKMADEEFKLEEIAKARQKRAKKEYVRFILGELMQCRFCGSTDDEPMETVILEKTIIKLGSLLALGFGEAGANIIGHNMRGGDSAGVNAMIPGTRVECIIGVVRIRDFSTATEVLQSKVMTFVNQIAEVVHGVVNEFRGAPNRNSGETFLVIWRMESHESLLNPQDPTALEDKKVKLKAAGKLAGMSIVAFSKILGGLHRSPLLATYRGHPGLQYRLGANCRVNLSFGLHAGWAIEGAVGSEFKIDASYLSPNVSIATSVERATQTYGVSLMVAQSVVELCPVSVVSKCRLIDRVIITGSAAPMEIYCVDLDYRAVSVDTAEPLQIVWNTRNRFKVRQFLESERTAMQSDSFDVLELFDGDQSIRDMRRRYTVEFFQLFNMGYQNYSQGEWQVARRMLSCTRAILGTEDGPSSALLRHMEFPYKFEAPREWQGVRELVTTVAVAETS